MNFAQVLTSASISAICPRARPDIVETLLTDAEAHFLRAGIDSEVKLAHFFGQIAAETGGLGRIDENLNYTSAQRLQAVYGRRLFPTLGVASQYVRAPQKLANYVYANKIGNGDTASGDGWNYRGSGLIQLTGRENFRNAGTLVQMPLEQNPDLARHSDSALAIALAYWVKRDISSVAGDATDQAVEAVTRRINPAMLGLAERKAFFKKALRVFRQQARATDMSGVAAPPAAAGGAATAAAPAAPALATPEKSGPQWVTRFPTSRSIDDLAQPFSSNVAAFTGAMRAAGATARIAATYRPKERAYLMHWAWDIAKLGVDPADVPAMAGVDIDWVHASLNQSKSAARAMVTAYGIVSRPSLNSRHTERRAIDMTISWQGDLTIARSSGSQLTINTQPRNGGNDQLRQVGREYGVIKLPSDPPHWSDDGR
jgi:predicted chitinase